MKRNGLLIASLACILSGPAIGAVLDFEDVLYAEARTTQELWGLDTDIYTKGYLLRYAPARDEPYPTGFQAVAPLWRYIYRDTIAINPNSCSALVTLVAQDNNPFDLHSIDLQELNGVGEFPAQVTFWGVSAGHRRVHYSVKLDNTSSWQTIAFPHTFRNLQQVQWHQGNCLTNAPHMFDNIFLEPSHLAGRGKP